MWKKWIGVNGNVKVNFKKRHGDCGVYLAVAEQELVVGAC
jgi:hypothetical protein